MGFKNLEIQKRTENTSGTEYQDEILNFSGTLTFRKFGCAS